MIQDTEVSSSCDADDNPIITVVHGFPLRVNSTYDDIVYAYNLQLCSYKNKAELSTWMMHGKIFQK